MRDDLDVLDFDDYLIAVRPDAKNVRSIGKAIKCHRGNIGRTQDGDSSLAPETFFLMMIERRFCRAVRVLIE